MGLVANDMFAIYTSTIASTSTFSNDGCILDPFHSLLNPNTIKGLSCTHNWFDLR